MRMSKRGGLIGSSLTLFWVTVAVAIILVLFVLFSFFFQAFSPVESGTDSVELLSSARVRHVMVSSFETKLASRDQKFVVVIPQDKRHSLQQEVLSRGNS